MKDVRVKKEQKKKRQYGACKRYKHLSQDGK